MLLWCDGFDHYGVTANLVEGVYAERGVSVSLSAGNPRTGTHCINFNVSDNNNTRLRRVLGGSFTSVGIAGAFFYASLPTSNGRQKIFDFRSAANGIGLTLILQTTGVLAVYEGISVGAPLNLLGDSGIPVITANAYNHIEMFTFFSTTVGTTEVRVNGVTIISLSGVNTGLSECSQVSIGGVQFNSSTGTVAHQVDDIFCYNDAGSFNNTFIGDRRILTLFPDADTIQADWTPVGSATGFGAIDEASPDGDTTYITAGAPATPGIISEFGIQNLPAGISAISAVVIVEMARKTEAGDANTQWSVISGASETAGADKPMTEVYTYRQDVFETDPASAAPFMPSEVDALLIKVERTQ